MDCPYPLHLAFAAPGQFGSTLDRLTCAAQRDDALMGGGIGYTPRIFTGSLGDRTPRKSRDPDGKFPIRSSVSYSYARLLS
jgi:hypothetical protein